MKISNCFSVVKREEENYLVNVDEGDVYYVNDVTIDIIEFCEKYETIEELRDFIFAKYSSEGDYSKEDLHVFIKSMQESGIIVK